jgi:hypothetical protein
MYRSISMFIITISIAMASLMSWANEDDEMAEMQRQLNAEVMAQPFDPADVAKVDSYIKNAIAKGIKPEGKAPSYWQPGYTCDYIRRYHYRYNSYRNCLYHHRYYGRYW